jgi:hypothetical protein
VRRKIEELRLPCHCTFETLGVLLGRLGVRHLTDALLLDSSAFLNIGNLRATVAVRGFAQISAIFAGV